MEKTDAYPTARHCVHVSQGFQGTATRITIDLLFIRNDHVLRLSSSLLFHLASTDFFFLELGVQKDPEIWVTSLNLYKLSLSSPPSHSPPFLRGPANLLPSRSPFSSLWESPPPTLWTEQGCSAVVGAGRMKTEDKIDSDHIVSEPSLSSRWPPTSSI